MKKIGSIGAALCASLLVLGGLFTACPQPETEPTEEKTLKSIELNTDNVKSVFTVGDDFTSEGLVVKAKYNIGAAVTLDAAEYDVTLPDENYDENGKIKLSKEATTEEATVTVTYKDKTETYTVTINKDAVTKIELDVTNAVVEYETGDKFDTTGITVKAFKGESDTTGEDVTSKANISLKKGDTAVTTLEETGKYTVVAEYAGKTANAEIEITVKEPEKYYEYFLGAGAEDIAAVKGFQDWGNGSGYKDESDGSITITPGTGWGSSLANLAYGDIAAGYFSRFDRVVAVVDDSAFTATEVKVLLAGSGDDAVVVEGTTEDGLTTYVADFTSFTKTATSTQIALQFFGTGTVTVKKWYFEAASNPGVFKAPLENLLTAVEEFESTVTVGTDGGMYPEEAHNTFVAVIESATAVAESAASSQSEIYAAYIALSEAKAAFEKTLIPDFPFTALSGTEIPADATVIFDSKNAGTSLFGPTQTWNVPNGGTFTIKQDDFDADNKIIEVVTKGDNACGCYTLNVSIEAGQKLYVSCYSAANTAIKPVKPDAETAITGKDEWQLIEVEYAAAGDLTQFGIVGKTAEANSLFIDAVYVK